MKIIWGFLCLFFLIFFHELGHFIAAKMFGVKVEAFSIGFGPVLLHKKRRGTDYRLSLIPLGGYCAMKGEKDFQKSLDAHLSYIHAESDSLYGVHPLKRIAIAFAGPFFNALFASFAFFLIAMLGYTYYSYSPKIILVDELNPEIHSAAREAGLLSGDIITKINNIPIENFSDIVTEISIRPDENVQVEVLRGEQPLVFSVHTDFDKESGTGKIGVAADTTSPKQYESIRYSFFPALWQGIKETGKAICLTIRGIAILFKGANLENSVSGPARIVDMMGGVVTESFSVSIRAGIVNMCNFMAYISVSLFIMNLLPIPILDGGLILFAFIELVARRKISPKVLYYIQFVGIAFILFMLVIGLWGDTKYFIAQWKAN
ncbi:MAG: PDZ domain-containing protein [Treponema sp.]|nr:PDZ domain-containing protein [Treponema sp.]